MAIVFIEPASEGEAGRRPDYGLRSLRTVRNHPLATFKIQAGRQVGKRAWPRAPCGARPAPQ
jgi:hypothetical protein